jgi:hypothetical protein
MTKQDELIIGISIALGFVFLVFMIVFFLYKYCFKRNPNYNSSSTNNEDAQYLLSNVSMSGLVNSNRQSSDMMVLEKLQKINKSIDINDSTLNYNSNSNDDSVLESVKKRRKQILKESREAAYIYLQLFARSEEMNIQTIEHLAPIGSQQQQRNWFLVVYANKIDNGKFTPQTNSKPVKTVRSRPQLIIIDSFTIKYSASRLKLIRIAENLSITLKEMTNMMNDFFVSLQHANLLPLYLIHVDFERERTLLIQKYCEDGSLRDLIQSTNLNWSWEDKVINFCLFFGFRF